MFSSFFTCLKPPYSFMMQFPNYFDCSTEFFAKAFLFTPTRTKGDLMPKGNHKSFTQKNFLGRAFLLYITFCDNEW